MEMDEVGRIYMSYDGETVNFLDDSELGERVQCLCDGLIGGVIMHDCKFTIHRNDRNFPVFMDVFSSARMRTTKKDEIEDLLYCLMSEAYTAGWRNSKGEQAYETTDKTISKIMDMIDYKEV
jgi:hypothetical protein